MAHEERGPGADPRLPNKGMKLTSVELIGRSQLIPGVLLLVAGTTKRKPSRVWTRRHGSRSDAQAAPPPMFRRVSPAT
jgi:hypothetical protein